jgi:hypothetical protein
MIPKEGGFMQILTRLREFLRFSWLNTKVKALIAGHMVRDYALLPTWKFVKRTLFLVFVSPFLWVFRQFRWISAVFRANRKEILIFCHISLGAFLVIWGVEIFSLWRILLGIYILLWVGVPFLVHLFKVGLYLD